MTPVYELNVDGLVGPTHQYAGLALGNIASEHNAATRSNPQAAALQGLAKMRLLHGLGLKQALLPPHQRPNLRLLHQLGFRGNASSQVKQASRHPELLTLCYSASSMWTANAATVSPSSDTADGLVHFTPANLITHLHRQQETAFSECLLKAIFNHPQYFHHHAPLPSSLMTSDEGAANHNRLCQSHAHPGVHVFVYGKKGQYDTHSGPKHYPARQTLEASEAIARLHKLSKEKVLFARQNPKVIDQGVFHNDVIAVANESVFLVHEEAFCNQKNLFKQLMTKMDFPLTLLEVPSRLISVEEAVSSYLFNSQLVSLADQSMVFIAPIECQQNRKVKAYFEQLIDNPANPISQIYFLDLRQSMRNGGGPACLRLRVPLRAEELEAMHPGVLINDDLLIKLETWVKKHYRTDLVLEDLGDTSLMQESFQALDELSQILNLGSIYPFQLE